MRTTYAAAPKSALSATAICLGIAAVLCAIAVLAITIGAVPLSIPQVIDGLMGGENAFIVLQYRAPRIAVSIMAGAALAVAGVFLQGAIRNPLASPDVVGITKGAGLGAMLMVILVPPLWQVWAIPAGVIGGAALAALMLLGIGQRLGGGAASLALVGISIGAICQALMQYLMVRYPGNADQSMVWLAGSVYGSNAADIWALGSWLLACLPAVILLTGLLDVTGFGDDSLTSLGLYPMQLRAGLIMVAVALAAGGVASIGSMGFLGLIAPHMARVLVGPRARALVPASALIGALALCSADLIGRVVALPNEIPAGIVASVIGGPYLLFLLIWEARKNA